MASSSTQSKWSGTPLTTGILMAAASLFGIEMSRFSGDVSSFWIANAIVFMYVLRVRTTRQRFWHLLAATLANAVVIFAVRHYTAGRVLTDALSNAVEIAMMLALTQKYYEPATRKFRITAPLFTASTMGVVALVVLVRLFLPESWMPERSPADILHLYGRHVLGMLIVSALCTYWRARTLQAEFGPGRRLGTWFCLFAVATTTILIFSQSSIPSLYVTIPILIYVVFERGPAIATLAVILTAFITTAFTVHGYGPVAAITKLGPLGQAVYLQIYIAIVLITVYPIGRALHKQRSLQRLYTLLSDNTRDVITRRTVDGVRIYCSPSVVEVLGWTPEEVTTLPSSQLLHPEDMERHAAVIRELSAGKPSAVLVYRSLTKAGEYVWMEGHFRMTRDPHTNKPTEILSTSRDITKRIAAEEGLQAAYRKLERLASTDALTGLPNRRTFDETLEREWRRAMRERTPVALLMMDVDNFKAYNDALGHPAGDECLRRIAQCLAEIVQRPGDLSARYGGEEFVILLPITDESGALHIARLITEALANLAIPHPANGAADRVTLSLGIASLVPAPGGNPEGLVDAADHALYEAKRQGRDRIEIAWPDADTSAFAELPETIAGRA